MEWLNEIEKRLDGTRAGVWTQKTMKEFRDHAPRDIAKLIAAVRLADKELNAARFSLCGNKDIFSGDISDGALRYNAHVAVRYIGQALAQLQSGEFEDAVVKKSRVRDEEPEPSHVTSYLLTLVGGGNKVCVTGYDFAGAIRQAGYARSDIVKWEPVQEQSGEFTTGGDEK